MVEANEKNWLKIKKYLSYHVNKYPHAYREDIFQELYIKYVQKARYWSNNPLYDQDQEVFDSNVFNFLKMEIYAIYKIQCGLMSRTGVNVEIIHDEDVEITKIEEQYEYEYNYILEDLDFLTPQQLKYVELLLMDKSFGDIAKICGVTKMAVSNALRRLSNIKKIQDYFQIKMITSEIKELPNYIIHNIRQGMNFKEAKKHYKIDKKTYIKIKNYLRGELI